MIMNGIAVTYAFYGDSVTGRENSRMVFSVVAFSTWLGGRFFNCAILPITSGRINEEFRVRRSSFGGRVSLQ
jgi:hypothetical protein